MQEKINPILRFKAASIDALMLLALLAFSFFFMMFLNTFILTLNQSINVALLFLPLLIYLGYEYAKKSSPGKLMVGLAYNIPDHFRAGLLIRNILKFAVIAAVLFYFLIYLSEGAYFLKQIQRQKSHFTIFSVTTVIFIINLIAILLGRRPIYDNLSGIKLKIVPSSYHKTGVNLLAFFGVFAPIFLIIIILPNFIGTGGRCCKVSSVKANMHTMQTMVETYAVDWRGIYPPNVKALYKEANLKKGKYGPYWKDFSSPYTGYSGPGQSYANEGVKTLPGMVTYEAVGTPHHIIYYIYGHNKNGDRIKQKGKDFYLTNS